MEDGSYPEQTIYGRVDNRLRQIGEQLKKATASDKEEKK
jgi:hypothetical protein